jgi:hypothetical protein
VSEYDLSAVGDDRASLKLLLAALDASDFYARVRAHARKVRAVSAGIANRSSNRLLGRLNDPASTPIARRAA